MTTSSAPRRQFRYQHPHGRFFSPLDGANWDAPYGVWELRGTADALPEGLYGVQLNEPGGGGPSDEPGLTWQDRAVRAEMAAASLRVELAEAKRRQGDAEHNLQVANRAAGQEGRALRAELAMQRNQLEELAGNLAVVYQRGGEFLGLQEPDVDDPEHVPHEPTFGELHDFVAETLRLDHPSVRYPLPSSATTATAAEVFRANVGGGASIETALSATLARLAADAREAGQGTRPGRWETRTRTFTVESADDDPVAHRVSWAAAAADARCPACGHERGEHVGDGGKHCEHRLRDVDLPAGLGTAPRHCGCMGPMTVNAS